MGNKLNQKKYDDYLIASALAAEKFREIHPEEQHPPWLKHYIRVRGNRTPERNWIITAVVMHQVQLEPHQHWEWIRDVLTIIEVDPETGKEYVMISGGPPTETDTVFEAEVNSESGEVTVLVDIDLDTLDETKYQAISRDPVV